MASIHIIRRRSKSRDTKKQQLGIRNKCMWCEPLGKIAKSNISAWAWIKGGSLFSKSFSLIAGFPQVHRERKADIKSYPHPKVNAAITSFLTFRTISPVNFDKKIILNPQISILQVSCNAVVLYVFRRHFPEIKFVDRGDQHENMADRSRVTGLVEEVWSRALIRSCGQVSSVSRVVRSGGQTWRHVQLTHVEKIGRQTTTYPWPQFAR